VRALTLRIGHEPHIFHKQLGPGDRAVKEGLAYPRAGTKPYPPLSKRYDQIARAIDIDETAALNSVLGPAADHGLQLPGRRLSQPESHGEFHDAGTAGAALAFVKLLIDWKLAETLRKHDWRTFALKYNGPNALKNGYDKKLQKASYEVALPEQKVSCTLAQKRKAIPTRSKCRSRRRRFRKRQGSDRTVELGRGEDADACLRLDLCGHRAR
jgi:hypothetical protein